MESIRYPDESMNTQNRKSISLHCNFLTLLPLTWLPGHSGGDDDDVGPLERLLELFVGHEAGGLGLGLHVREVGGHAGGVHDVVQAQAGDGRVQLEQERQGLADA